MQLENKTTPDEKIVALSEALRDARQAGDTAKMLATLTELGQAYLAEGDAPKALTQFDEGLKLAQEQNDLDAESQFLGLRGLALRDIGNFSRALNQFQKSNRIAKKINHPLLACDSYFQIARLLSEKGNTAKALSNLSKAMKIAANQEDQKRKMGIANLFADTFYQEQAFEKATKYYLFANEIAEELHNPKAACSFLTKAGNVYLVDEAYESAIEQYERALHLAARLEDARAEMHILGGLFRAHARHGEVGLALMYADRAIQAAQTIGHLEAELANLQTLVSYLMEKSKFEEALPYIERCFGLADQHNDHQLQQSMALLSGFCYYNLGQHDAALQTYNQAIELAVRFQDQLAEASALSRKSAILADMGDLDQALELAQLGLQKAEQEGDKSLIGELQALLAFTHQDLGNGEKAKTYTQDAIKTYQALGQDAQVELLEGWLEQI